MPAGRISMRKIREVLRLKYELGLGEREIALSCHISKTSVNRYIEKTKQAALTWPLPNNLDDKALECLLYPSAAKLQYIPPDWFYIHQEIKKKGVTLELLWSEYQASEPRGISYSRFCELYRKFKQTLNPVMRQTHKAGEKLFVDYAGLTVPWIEPATGEIFEAQIFVAVLGASNYTYVEATQSQGLIEWKKVRAGIDYHVAFEHHYYSVPHQYIKHELTLRITRTLVQCFYKGKLIAIHARANKKGHTTVKEHMPKRHQAYAQWTPERLLRWAQQTGEQTHQLIHAMIKARPQPQQAFRACLGVMRLGKQYGSHRLEKAAQRALVLGALSYKSIESILKHGLDQKPLPQSSHPMPVQPISHEHLHGADYYH